jgi:hypothetical protein
MKWDFIFGHWILTLLSGPAIFIIKSTIYDSSDHNIFGFIQWYPLMIILGLMFSIPTYVIICLIFVLTEDQNINIIYAKMFFILFVLIGIWTTTFIISGGLSFDIAVSYSIGAVIAGIFFKSNYRSEEEL